MTTESLIEIAEDLDYALGWYGIPALTDAVRAAIASLRTISKQEEDKRVQATLDAAAIHLPSEIPVLERSYVYMDVEFNEAQWKIVFELLEPKAKAAEALSKAILEAHEKWAATYHGVGHV